MDKNQKLLKKLSRKEFLAVQKVIAQLLDSDASTLDIKKISGQRDIYRVRVQNIRVIFLKTKNDIEVLDISRRSEKTYKDY